MRRLFAQRHPFHFALAPLTVAGPGGGMGCRLFAVRPAFARPPQLGVTWLSFYLAHVGRQPYVNPTRRVFRLWPVILTETCPDDFPRLGGNDLLAVEAHERTSRRAGLVWSLHCRPPGC